MPEGWNVYVALGLTIMIIDRLTGILNKVIPGLPNGSGRNGTSELPAIREALSALEHRMVQRADDLHHQVGAVHADVRSQSAELREQSKTIGDIRERVARLEGRAGQAGHG